MIEMENINLIKARTLLTAKRSFGFSAPWPRPPKNPRQMLCVCRSQIPMAKRPFSTSCHFAEARVAAGKLPRAARDVSVVRVNVSRGVAAVLSPRRGDPREDAFCRFCFDCRDSGRPPPPSTSRRPASLSR